MKANIGIRRRLAPLLDNDLDTLELFTALLLSLPGSPVLYYGDEIGMGDNIWLGDRDGVRTPMQWTPDRNGGFSTADPQPAVPAAQPGPDLRLPGHQRRVAAAQPTSLLHWIAADDPGPQGSTPTFGLGTFVEIGGHATRRVLSFVREFGDDIVLCVNNLSRFPQPVELDLRRFEGYTPIELTGRVRVPADRRPALHAHARRARLLLVRARQAGRAGGRGGARSWETHRQQQRRRVPARRRAWSAPPTDPRRQRRSAEAPTTTAPETPDEGPDRPARASGCPASAGSAARAGSGPTSPRTASSSTAATRCCRCTGSGSATPTGTPRPTWCRCPGATAPAEELASAFVGAVPGTTGGRTTPTTRCATATPPRPWLIHLVNASTVGPMHFHPAGVAYIPEGLPGDIVSDRAEQHLAGLRRRGDPQAVPPAGARAQPGRRDPRRAAPARRTSTSPPLLGHIEIDDADPAQPAGHGRRCCRPSCPTPATAGGWPPPASATCTPRATCTPTRWAATSPATASGWARPPPSVHADMAPVLPTEPADRGLVRRGRRRR